jgi:hypothetical protein
MPHGRATTTFGPRPRRDDRMKRRQFIALPGAHARTFAMAPAAAGDPAAKPMMAPQINQSVAQSPHFKEYTFAWLRKARDCSLRHHPWHPAVWRGPWPPRMSIAGAFGPASPKQVLAAGRVARQPTVALSSPRSDCPRTGEWLLRIAQCLRCKDRLEPEERSSRASRQPSAPLLVEVLTSDPAP